MKSIFASTLMTCLFYATQAQIPNQKQVLIIPCAAGSLYVDGVFVSELESNDPSRQVLAYGEHYIQLKNANGKKNLTILVNDTLKNVIKIGCEENQSIHGTRLIHKTLALSGLLSNANEENIFALDNQDELNINASVMEKKGTATLFITNAEGREIYRKQDFRTLENERITVPNKGIYKISLYTDALFGKTASITINRIPGAGSSPGFNTSPKLVFDTTFVEILQTVSRVYSGGNIDHPNKTAVSINLPPNTTYWTYWIGVDQAAQNSMKNFINDLSPALKLVSSNPLVLFGMKLIPSLPVLNVPATINYKFMSSINAQNYVNGRASQYYAFKHADNICTDYSWVNINVNDLVLTMENESAMQGHNVEIRVVAFTVRKSLIAE